VTESVALPPISGECVVTEREPLSPVAGKPNLESEKISGPQKVMLLMIVVGSIALIGLLAYLPSVAKPLQ
jgi:hypothetical protein